VQVDLRKLTSDALVDLQLHRNDWYVRHARRILQERGADARVHERLKVMLREQRDVTRRLRALWTLHVTGGLTDRDTLALLDDRDEYMRSWAVYLLVEGRDAPDEAVRRFAVMAREDPSALVRLYLASALQRIPAAKRWDTVGALLARAEDSSDHNLPLMVWYAAEPLAALDMPRALALAADSKLPNVFSFTVRRIAALQTPDALRVLAERLARTDSSTHQRDLVDGINQIVRKQ
jgi:hypothetical protein